MKRRLVYRLLTFAIAGTMIMGSLTACGLRDAFTINNPAGSTSDNLSGGAGPDISVSSDNSAEVSPEDIEARIKEVGESYDGIYDDSDELNIMFNTMTAESFTDGTAATPKADNGSDYIEYEDIDWDTESYNYINENSFMSASASPFSTFGADVDTATYSNLRRSLYMDDGYGIPDDAVRIEEMINYFSYNYTAPADGSKFGVNATLNPCPWNEDTLLLKVGVKAEEIKPANGSNIVFLIDTSGSMFADNKLPLVQESFKILQEQLTDKDTVSIVTYAGDWNVLLNGAKGSDHEEILEALESLEAYGGTNGEGGILKAYDIAEENFIEGGNNRIILATDGDLNIGASSEAELISLVEDKRNTGVFLSCLGFGNGNFKDDKMEALADYGNGNYAFIDCSREAERVLKDEIWSTLYTVAKDVKFQIEFNPELVKGYRLIGYENRAMAAEDFADDTKDGGEIGSGQTVTVLYEVVPIDSEFEVPEVGSRYAEETYTGSDELLAVNIRYKEPDADESTLYVYPVTMSLYSETMDADTSWAAGVAQLGMLLKDSEYMGTTTYNSVRTRLTADPRIMDDDLRAEFLYLIDLAKNR